MALRSLGHRAGPQLSQGHIQSPGPQQGVTSPSLHLQQQGALSPRPAAKPVCGHCHRGQMGGGGGSQKAQEHSGGTEVKPATVHEGWTGRRLRHLWVSQLPKAGPMGGRPGVSRTGKPPGWEGGSCSSQEPRGAHWERPLGSNLEVCACSPKALDSHGKLQSSGGLGQRGERSDSCGCTAQPGRNLGWRGPESEWEEDTRERK